MSPIADRHDLDTDPDPDRSMTEPDDLADDRDPDPDPEPAAIAPPAAADEPPLVAYRSALRRYPGRLLQVIASGGASAEAPATAQGVDAIVEGLARPRAAGRLIAGLEPGSKMALALAATAERPEWPWLGLAHALSCLGFDPAASCRALLEAGLMAILVRDDAVSVSDFALSTSGPLAPRLVLRAHPSALAAVRTPLPTPPPPGSDGPVRHVREADGLEPILRLAVVWQRLDEAPLRQTQQGTLYKRDRERLEDDPAVVGPIADALEPLPDMAPLWLALARGVGLVESEPGSDKLAAARPDFWDDNAVHLPQMAATRWLGLSRWHEQIGMRADDAPHEPALPYARAAILLWLAAAGEGRWVALDDLAATLRARCPEWDRPLLVAAEPPPARPGVKPARKPAEADAADPSRSGLAALEAVLLGAAYQFGLVRVAESDPDGARVVQLTPLGRYALALGPPPPGRETFEHFLHVQPNFEVIAYRQGLTPALVGQVGRFIRWTRLGAALELKLTPESVYRGLEGGLTPQSMLDRLTRHSPRALPAGVAEALRTWAGRRDRVTYHAAATLMEFGSAADLEAALDAWASDGRGSPPARVGDRLLLVEDESTIPFSRFRLAGSRDYRRPPEACVEVEADGVTLALDLARSDLLVDAELARLAEELPWSSTARPGGAHEPRRRFRMTRATLARAIDAGLTPASLSRWFSARTGGDVPPAIRLLLHASSPAPAPVTASRPLVLRAPSAELLDGLAQHPSTALLLGERLGPTAVVVPDISLAPLADALVALGLRLDEAGSIAPEPAAPPPKSKAGRRPS